MYKIINNLVDIPSHTLLIPPDGRTRGTTVYRVIYTRIDAYKYSFFPRTILTWSHIPQELRLVPTIDQFRAGLGSVTLPAVPSVNNSQFLIVYRIGFYLYSLVMLGVSTLKYEYTPDGKKKK
jgi:hypothetical protein